LPTPTITRTPLPTQTPPGTRCVVAYRTVSQWGSGFTAEVGVSVSAGTVEGWTLTFTLGSGQRITTAWNAAVTQDGARVTARDVGWNSRLGSSLVSRAGPV